MTADHPRIWACTVAFGRSPGLTRLVEVLLADEAIRGVAVVDNGAEIDAHLRDGTVAHCEVIVPPTNVGYAAGVAAAVAWVGDDWDALLVINPDIALDPAGLRHLLEVYGERRPALTSGPLVEHGVPGSNLRGATGPWRELVKAVCGSTTAWRFRRGSGYPSGALMLIDHDAWVRFGGLDPHFELYYEDVDLVDRFRAAGATVRIVDRVVGEHVGGVSSRKGSGRAFTVLRISRMRYLRRRHGTLGAWVGLLLTLLELPGHVVVRRRVPLSTWWATVGSSVAELRRPGSVRALTTPPDPAPQAVDTTRSGPDETSVSVALCTYQGAAFIGEQLASIAGQTRLPDEVVVCDDGSADGTVDIVENWAHTVPFPVRTFVNAENLGVGRNFDQAIGRCSGELIALCDQDDVWRPDRLERQVAALRSNPDAGYCFSDADLIGELGEHLPGRLWARVRFHPSNERISGEAMVRLSTRRGVVTGATTMIRRDVALAARPIPVEWIHDHWVSLVAGAAGTGAFADPMPTISYRIHAAQAAGLRRVGPTAAESLASPDDLTAAIRRFEVLVDRIDAIPAERGSRAAALVHSKLAHLRRRQRARGRSLPALLPIVVELATGRYHSFSNGWRSAAADLRPRSVRTPPTPISPRSHGG